VIAPLWNVDDEIAFEVAKTFYERVVAEPRTPFAEIMREIRGRAYVAGGGATRGLRTAITGSAAGGSGLSVPAHS